MAAICIMYPAGAFNLKYFLNNHMPLVQDTWGSEGLESWEAIQLSPGVPYMLQLVLKFEKMQQWDAASTGPNANKVFDDIANFCSVQPEIMRGTIRDSHRTTLKEKKIFGS
ncbi:hypothetical protein VFPPC_13981 [Pochonia chlamydosporia 170]|uniref:Ethyl tert-butyl ether degradation EthD n=1 Tax=Pochonia chlamydosporia 170 TaxID=1380566 RepID=A0A179FHJ9_METCM|nr:hypothetical protein VFPPC_13981 [Pochonia chlamydosporia 170]OAQ65014.1 hypothetical protein VFPPC_13981 [Pochonia chlamydosporia 170]